jgi:hypothetical protein
MIDEAPQGKGVGLVANMPVGNPGELPEAGDRAGLGHVKRNSSAYHWRAWTIESVIFPRVEHVRVPVAHVGLETEGLPESDASGGGVDGYQLAGTHRVFKQGGGELPTDAGTPKVRYQI